MKNKRIAKNDSSNFALFIRACKILWEICPQYLIWQIVTGIFEAVTSYFGAYMSALIINELVGECNKNSLVLLVMITVIGGFGINILLRIFQGRRNVWQHNSMEKEELFYQNIQNRMKYETLESSDVAFLREKIFADKNANGGGLLQVQWTIPSIVANISRIITSISLSVSIFYIQTNGEYSGFMAFINSPYSLLLLVILVILQSNINIKISNIKSIKTSKEWENLAYSNMRYITYDQIWGIDSYIFNMKKIILAEQEKRDIHPKYIVNSSTIVKKYNTILTVVATLVNLWLFIFVAAKAFIGIWGIGNFILYKTTIERLMSSITGIACDIGRLKFNGKYLRQLYRFIDLPKDTAGGNLLIEDSSNFEFEIEFRNVSFKYPNTEVYALKNINFKFKSGDRLAIVGENGSGKTTFVKLLCRLYEPTEGDILLNGINISNYQYKDYFRLFSVVFQDYKLFSFSVATNVSSEHEYNPLRVKECLSLVGLGEKIEHLEKGILTSLHNNYENDGIELSGGEEQKLALARALYKNAPIFVLDEPTASLDPIAESDIYANFNLLVKGKTMILISHRLSACTFCDDIIVFDHGSIIQQGNHKDLLSKTGHKYSQLWNAQAQYYKNQ